MRRILLSLLLFSVLAVFPGCLSILGEALHHRVNRHSHHSHGACSTTRVYTFAPRRRFTRVRTRTVTRTEVYRERHD